jgi:tetratricopeptide (TPR) repeat protein
MYKKGDFQNAVDAFTKSLLTEDKELEARANYNIANSKYSLGNLKINTDLSGSVSLYREALDYYKRAIELNQDDTEAKYNHELVEKKLKVLLDRLKNQPEEEQKNKDKQDQGQNKQDQQSNPESGSEQQKEEESGTEKQEQGTQDGNQDQQDQQSAAESGAEQQENEEKGEGQAVEQSPDEEAKEMSPEEARMLLDAYGDEEATQMKQGSTGYNDRVLKDW